MSKPRPLQLGMIWAQFAAYHVDRCEAVARRLGERATVRAIEVATTSVAYAWEPSGSIAGAEKVTLFPGRSFDSIPALRRFWAQLRAAWRCDVVCIGLSYGLPDALMLSWTLRLLGRRVIVFSESKFDDKVRSGGFELLKRIVLGCYHAAIVGGRRHIDYFRFLGFTRRPVLPGYDTVGVDRIRSQAAVAQAEAYVAFADRPFVFVGRFVDKKNLFTLLAGYARYVASAKTGPRRLVLVGSGPDGDRLRSMAREFAIAHLVDFPGFLPADAVAGTLAGAAGLVLVSREEQWGLVVNEALALGVPVIVSYEVGARDLLVRNLSNGYVVDSSSPDAIGRALVRIAETEAEWRAMSACALERSALGDAARLADAIEVLLFPDSAAARGRIDGLLAEMESPAG